MDRLIIAGIDPGTVGAYALLDIDGNIIKIDSGRELNKATITKEIIKHGKIFMVGCDVYQPPVLVSRIASSLGAKVMKPDHDLKYLEKIRMVAGFLKTKKDFVKLSNKHEKDALTAALYGLKKINGLLKKIDDHLEQKGKLHLTEEVKRKVLLEEMPISEAVKILS